MTQTPASPSRSRPPAVRLRTPKEFTACFQQGQRVSAQFYRCVALLPATGLTARLGFAISRKVDSRAVVRNRLKRIAREWFRHCRAELPAGDYVLMARPEAASAPRAALHADLLKLQRRLLALKPPIPQGTMPADSEPVDPRPVTSGTQPSPTPSRAAAAKPAGAGRASE